jgi:hypothetical protein
MLLIGIGAAFGAAPAIALSTGALRFSTRNTLTYCFNYIFLEMHRLRRVTITAIGHEFLKRTVSNLKRRVQTLREPTKRQRGPRRRRASRRPFGAAKALKGSDRFPELPAELGSPVFEAREPARQTEAGI